MKPVYLVVAAVTLVVIGARALPGDPRPIDMPAVTTLASTLSGRAMVVQCQDDSHASGDTQAFSGDGGLSWQFGATMRLNRDICESLSGLLANPPELDRDAGRAVLVVTHEATHVRLGSVDEGYTECTAIRDVSQTIALLHLTAEDAQNVQLEAERAHAAMPEMIDNKPNPYRSVC
jgi:hypothetical protein